MKDGIRNAKGKQNTNKALQSKSKWGVYAAGAAAVIVLGIWHYQSVKAGALESRDFFLLSWYKVLTVCAAVTVLLFGYFYLVKRMIRTETFFLAGGLALGLSFLFVLQPLSAPDEIRHYISAYRLSNQMMGLPDTDEYGQVLIRKQDEFIVNQQMDGLELKEQEGEEPKEGNDQEEKERIVLGQQLTEYTYREVAKRSLKGTGEDELISSRQMAVQTTPLAYLAPGIGITTGRLLNMGGMGLLYLGRLFNLGLYLGVVWLALRRLPFGKPVMCAVALLPMTLHLAASFSYDTMINAMMFLFSAVCLDLAYSGKQVKVRDIVLLAAVIGIAGPCKMVYAPVMGLCLLIPVRKFGGWKKWTISAAAVLGTWLVAMILVNSQTISVYTAGTENYIGWAEETGYTMSGLLHRPGLMLQMFYNSLIWQAEYYHLTMIGAYLGQVDPVLDVPYIVVMGLTAALVLLSLQRPEEETVYFTGRQKTWIWVLFIGCAGATMFSMLLAWTPVTSLVIAGVQGRYFLPLLPVALMTLKNRWIICTANRDREILYMILCADAYAVLRLFSIVSMRI